MSMRRVRRLRVRAEHEDDARRAATLLSDALRTASLPLADQGRLVVIRTLPLGRISAHVSAPSLALQVERVLGEIVAQAVAYDLPSAADANAVAFPDRSDAIISLARRHARGAPTIEWFWGDVVRGWRADLSSEERWRLIIDAAHTAPEAPIVAAAVVAEAVSAGVDDALLSAVPPGQGARWLRMEGWTSAWPELAPAAPRHLDRLPRRQTPIIERWQARWGSADDRLIWLSTMLAIGDNRAVVADSYLPSRIADSLRRAIARESPRDTELEPRVASEHLEGRRSERAFDQRPNAVEHRLQPAAPSESDTATQNEDRANGSVKARRTDNATMPSAESAPDAESRVDVEPERRAHKTLSGHYTSHAGLLFLVPILDRLGIVAFLDANPDLVEIDFSARLIEFIGHRVSLSAEDPLALAFHREPLASNAAFDLEQRLIDWTTAVRRWCRRQARQGLHALIRRPGRVHISRTHLGARFNLPQIDVRLRRLALDVDPGWVPWIGRVVQFSYLERDEHCF